MIQEPTALWSLLFALAFRPQLRGPSQGGQRRPSLASNFSGSQCGFICLSEVEEKPGMCSVDLGRKKMGEATGAHWRSRCPRGIRVHAVSGPILSHEQNTRSVGRWAWKSQRESSSGEFLFGLLGFLWGRSWSSQGISLLEKLSPLEPLLSKECVCVLCTPWGICLETGDQCSWLVKVDSVARSMVGDGNLTCSLSCGHPLMWS